MMQQTTNLHNKCLEVDQNVDGKSVWKLMRVFIQRLLAQHLVPDQLHAAKAAGAESLDHVEVIEAAALELLQNTIS